MGNAGWMFPAACSPLLGRVEETDTESSVRRSIHLILTTKKGERFLHPEFGCDVYKFLFHGTDYTTLKQIEHEVHRSISEWEPRISGLNVEICPDSTEQGRILAEISYFIPLLNTAARQEIVYF